MLGRAEDGGGRFRPDDRPRARLLLHGHEPGDHRCRGCSSRPARCRPTVTAAGGPAGGSAARAAGGRPHPRRPGRPPRPGPRHRDGRHELARARAPGPARRRGRVGGRGPVRTRRSEGAEPATGVTPFGSGSLAGAAGVARERACPARSTPCSTGASEELASSRDRPVLLALGALLVLGYLLVAVWRSTSQDVRALLEDISTISNGQQPRQPAMEGSDEFARMSRAMTITRDRLTSLLGSLRYQATHDELTALGNRTLFTDKIAEALAEQGPGVAVVVADLDHFRDVNDSFGHAMGDRLLRAVGVRFHRACGRQNVVARLGQRRVRHPAAGGRRRGRRARRRRAAAGRAAGADRRRRAAAPGARDVRGGGRGRGPAGRRRAGPGRGRRPRRGARRRTRDASRRLGRHPRRRLRAGDARAHAGPHGAVRGARRGGRPGRAASSSTSRSSTSRRRPCTASRRSRAGTTRPAAWSPPTVFVPLAEATGSIVPIGRWVLREAALQLAALARASSPTATR